MCVCVGGVWGCVGGVCVCVCWCGGDHQFVFKNAFKSCMKRYV